MSQEQYKPRGEREITSIVYEWDNICKDLESGVREMTPAQIQQGWIAVSEKANELRLSVNRARSNSYTKGSFLDPQTFRGMEEKLLKTKILLQRLQMQLGAATRREKHETSRATSQSGEISKDNFHKAFFATARRKMPRAEFERLCQIAEASQMGDEGTQ